MVPKPPTVTLMVQAEVEVATDRLAGHALTREEASAFVDRAIRRCRSWPPSWCMTTRPPASG